MISKKKLEKFEKEINFYFKDKDNLLNALVHPSYISEKKLKKTDSNFERFEFLGDRVLGLSISSLLFNKFKKSNEGDLTKRLSYLVKKDFLYKIAIEIGIDNYLKYSYRKENTRTKISILSDSVESLIGSIYIDGGYSSAFKFIKKVWSPYLDIKASNKQDPKTNLQEIFQQKYKILPKYNLIKKFGPSHSPTFTVSLQILNFNKIVAKGNSKQEAEKNAAIKALKILNE